MNMDMLVTIVRVPLLVMPWIGYEFLGLRTRNNHICGRTFGSTVRLPQTFGSTVRLPQWYQSLSYIEQRFDHRYGCYESLTPKIHSLSTASLTGEPGL
ncbi:hypothetical protein PIB30_110955, partial [Stylosanthes scabra]|nr:hypothetical protein [Stylosanthes scabra]